MTTRKLLALSATLAAACATPDGSTRKPPSGSRAALVVMDMQHDFLAPDGKLPVAADQVDGMVAAANVLVDTAVQKGLLVVYVVNHFRRSQWLSNLFRHSAALEGSAGAGMDERVHQVSDRVFVKSQRDAFTNPAFGDFLRQQGVGHLLVAGVFADACVKATVQSALASGYHVTVVSDAVGARDERTRQKALGCMRRAGAEVARAAGLTLQLSSASR